MIKELLEKYNDLDINIELCEISNEIELAEMYKKKKNIINILIKTLNYDEKYIIKNTFFEIQRKTQKEMADYLKISERDVRRKKQKAIKKMQRIYNERCK